MENSIDPLDILEIGIQISKLSEDQIKIISNTLGVERENFTPLRSRD